MIGKGATVDNFADIDWGNGTFYVNVKVDGVEMGTSQLMSVPYALYALKAGSGGGGGGGADGVGICLLYTSPSPRDGLLSRMPSSA